MHVLEISDPAGVRFRRPTVDDVPGLLAVHGDARVYSLDPAERHTDEDYTRRWLEPILAHWDDRSFGYWTVLVPVDWWPAGGPGSGDGDAGRVIAGMGGVRRHLPLAGPALLNVYFRLAPAVQGRALARALVQSSIDWADQNLPDHDLVVRTRPANSAARHVAERAGFVDEGLEPGDQSMQQLRLAASSRRQARPVASGG